MEGRSFSQVLGSVLVFLLIGNVSLFSQDTKLPDLMSPDPVKTKKVKDRPKIFRHNQLTIVEKPYKAPSSIPSNFVPDDSEVLFFTELKADRLLENKEAVVVFKTSLPKTTMERYYEYLISSFGHKILQSQKSEEKSLYLVDVLRHKILAITIHPEEKGSIVKLFQKTTNGGF
ncbi:hypothetical protein EHQ81_15715 [Leptospira selangorensis]|uniref:Uncharacterized protein n=1 Tax=Leptospira selangorensis TaxID=2484982 RepID=A0A4R9FUX3_9LEPT|nr:hypothetical protein EHO58_17760 [Leptospira selangorensis]TGM11131.1 hypothetical protein EHQ81_15715 [Leptospira selangorensis]TGM19000.1 hypothetical protein EHQ82_11100 [Leptospira selangorensis]